jgi:hypothetical protein
LALAIVQYFTTVLTIDWFGVGIGSRQVKKSLNDRPDGTSLPPIGIPVDVDFNRQRLAVYFRPLPAKLWVGCAAADDEEAGDLRLVGGRWPTDGQPWTLSNDDAMLFVDSGELALFMEPDSVSGGGPPISVATAADGQRYLQVANEDPDKLRRLPRCDRQDNEIQAEGDESD